MNRRVLTAVAENVVAPLVVYGGAVWAGVEPVWALVLASTVSVGVLGATWWRRREVSTLGVLVGVRFLLGIAVAGLTGDARLVLAKNAAVTGVLAALAATTLLMSVPLIARIRRDLDPDPEAFSARWRTQPAYRSAHRRLTTIWVVGLSVEAVAVLAVVAWAPLTLAVIGAQVVPVPVLLALIVWTQRSGRRLDVAADRAVTGLR